MHSYLRHGVSAIAILAAISIAHAQTAERQGGEKGGTVQHMQSEHGGKSGAMQHEGGMAELGKETGAMRGKGNLAIERERGTAEHGRTQKQESGESREGKRAQEERRTQGQRTAKKTPSEEQREQTQREGDRKEQGTETRQHESQAGTAGRSEEFRREGERAGARISVNANQKTEIRDVIHRESGLRVYHRSDVHFAARVGERLPDTFVFYNAPPRLMEIVPDFRRYKIVVLDDEILVIDPATREIVDIIPT
jgi:Protein of unknown function (DUF1236)